ncbi:MAG: glycosyltransferase family 4 protein [Actinobacteria bacterium]|nr:glycosyltransferase family 4 protein [Actinomycetota bacterium]
MKIGIDISTILNHGINIGSGRYIFNLIKNLLEIDHEDNFVFTGRYTTDQNLSVIEQFKKYSNRENKIEFKLFKVTQKKLDLWNRLNFPPIEFMGFKADLLHCPDYLIPPTLNKNIILTIHDLAFIRYPEFNFDWFIKKYTREVLQNALKAKKIFADSISTKNDIVRFFKIDPEKIEVAYLAADNLFRKLEDGELNRNILKKYEINKKYILSVGTIEPRKNYISLIKAFNLLKINNLDISGNPKDLAFDYELVIVGKTGWKSESTYDETSNSPFKNDILFTGNIPDSDLIQLYNQAELFVYPSIFEGFGLPVMEAMKCGLPVITSNSSSLIEIAADKELLFEPYDFNDLALKMKSILKNGRLRKELSEKSLSHAAKFDWKKTAEKVLPVYKLIYK